MKKIKEFILREIADEYILIPTGSTTEQFNGMINLSETAAFIWNHIEEAETFYDLIDMITSNYDIDRQTAMQDAYEFINHMLMNQMITLSDKEKNW
ncbi:MAG: PqqD family protein [Traorella sp.]